MLSREQMIQHILDSEGRGVYYDPDDPGGRTAFGISFRYNPQCAIWDVIQEDETNLRAIGDAAIDFYEKLFDRSGAKLLPAIIRYPFFDAVVNLGQSRAVEILQRALNTYAMTKGWVSVDGILGPRTLDALRTVDYKSFCHTFALQRISYYRKKVLENPKKKKYFFGWVIRTIRVDDQNSFD
jgi:lysozyme family protein